MAMIVKDSFTNSKGICYDKVREIAFKKGELVGNLGKFVCETSRSVDMFFDSSDCPGEGVYIYQSHSNPNVAYRIYKEFNDYGFNGYGDEKLIQKLQERQHNVKMSQFPGGVVTVDGKIIGQEVAYFPFDITVYELFQKRGIKDPIKIYKEILKALEEMYKNGILYLDIHPKNFMLNPSLTDVKIDTIDFEYSRINFDDSSRSVKKDFFDNYRKMINKLNDIIRASTIVGEFKLTSSFDEAYDQLHTMKRKLSK